MKHLTKPQRRREFSVLDSQTKVIQRPHGIHYANIFLTFFFPLRLRVFARDYFLVAVRHCKRSGASRPVIAPRHYSDDKQLTNP